jgi:maltose O-acetyltransferase
MKLSFFEKILYFLYYVLFSHMPPSYFPVLGKFSKMSRRATLGVVMLSVGPNANIEKGVRIHSPKLISLGSNSGLGINCFVDGKVEIGSNVMMGPDCKLLGINHDFSSKDCDIITQGISVGKIAIGNNVWLGANVIVLSGVTIGDGAVIGAGSVVTRDLPSMSVSAGNPATVKKFR